MDERYSRAAAIAEDVRIALDKHMREMRYFASAANNTAAQLRHLKAQPETEQRKLNQELARERLEDLNEKLDLLYQQMEPFANALYAYHDEDEDTPPWT